MLGALLVRPPWVTTMIPKCYPRICAAAGGTVESLALAMWTQKHLTLRPHPTGAVS